MRESALVWLYICDQPISRTTQWRILILLLPNDLKEGKGKPLVAYARRCKLDKYMKLVSEAT